jgi:anti-sigma factor RsiW
MSMSPNKSERPYITCQQLIDFIVDYLEGGLSDEQHFEFERHLAVCPSCVNYLATYKETLQMSRVATMEREAPPLPEELVQRILQVVKQVPGS